jgi:hypothetical protein
MRRQHELARRIRVKRVHQVCELHLAVRRRHVLGILARQRESASP